MPSRRRFVGGCVGVGALALAGCTDVMDGGEASGTSDWTYDAGARFGASTVGTAKVDMAAVREAPIPGEFQDQLQSMDEDVESVGLEDVESVVATGFLEYSEQLQGASVVVLGEFDAEVLGGELEEHDLESVEAPEGWDRYEPDHDDAAIAVREDAMVVGFADGQKGRDVDPVAAGIAAGAGDATPFTDRKNGETLRDALSGDAAVAVDLGSEWRQELGSGFGSEENALGTIIGTTQAFGLDATFQGETTALSYVVVADPEELDVETVRSFLQEAREAEGNSFDDVSVSRDGRAIVASTSMATEALLDTHESVLFGRRDRVQQTAPSVALSAERTDDDRVRLTHVGGDSVERLEVRYEGVERMRSEVWTGDPISAGDTHLTDHQVDAEGTVTVVWRSEDGTQASTLFRTTV